ncbi:hypothetical protein M404DRAFT_848361 [Pisolithus tinctorius Marx 270]|uniref:Uncharacterized protein n=1 Tax=Pisolithus tinctorius Marx 270 TaxID=870435 RepID=A0A0C3INJ4_PISTI|nr:hypothetical protein M404DRAFT_848361 [Pisolithus tinctorius Marx 270]
MTVLVQWMLQVTLAMRAPPQPRATTSNKLCQVVTKPLESYQCSSQFHVEHGPASSIAYTSTPTSSRDSALLSIARDYSKGHSQRLACAAARLGRLSSVTGTIHRNVIATTGHMMGRRDSPPHCRHDSLPHRSHMNKTENGDVESHMPTANRSTL